MGTPDFAAVTLEYLYNAGHTIALVVTQPDRPKGRHGEPQKSDVRIAAEKYGIPVITPDRIRRDEAAKDAMRAVGADVCVVTAFGQILPEDVLNIPKYGCINVHASLLPKYRGASPIQWAVLNGDEESGVTTMQMDIGLDTGDILLQKRLKLDPRETGGSLFDRLAVLGGETIVETLALLEEGKLTRTPQDHEAATKVGQFTRSSGLIDWSRPAKEIDCRIRGLNPWPSAYSFLNGRQLKIWDAEVVSASAVCGEKKAVLVSDAEREDTGETETGALYQDGSTLYVRCGQDALRLTVIQLEGKKRMETADFLRGYRFT